MSIVDDYTETARQGFEVPAGERRPSAAGRAVRAATGGGFLRATLLRTHWSLPARRMNGGAKKEW